MNPIQKYDNQISWFTAISYFSIAIKHIWLWVSPIPSDMSIIVSLSMLVAFEFIMLHSGLFMLAFSEFKKMVLFFILIYGLFAFGFNYFMPNNEIIYLYMFVILSRMRIIFIEKNENLTIELFKYSGLRMALYFVLIIPTVLSAKYIPALGLTKQFLSENKYDDFTINMSGTFIKFPQVALFFGFTYFTLLGIFDCWKLLNKKKAKVKQKSYS